MRINTISKLMKVRQGQTIYLVNPYGVVDPKDLKIQKLFFVQHNDSNYTHPFFGNHVIGNSFCFKSKSVWDVDKCNDGFHFYGDVIYGSKFLTTSRRDAERKIKEFQTCGYPDDVERHNQEILEREGWECHVLETDYDWECYVAVAHCDANLGIV